MKPSKARRVLVYRIGQLGDTIIAVPALRAIRKHFHAAHLALLTDAESYTGHVSVRDVVEKHKLFDEYLFYDPEVKRAGPRSVLNLLTRLRKARYDTLVYLAPRQRSGWQVFRDLVFFRLAGITRFVGHRGTGFPRPVPGIPLPRLEHEADHLLSRLARDGVPVPPPGEAQIDLALTEPELAEAHGWLEAHVGKNPSGTLIALGPGAKAPSKVWPQDRFAALGHLLIKEFGAFLIVFGGPELKNLGDRLLAEWGSGANAAGAMNIRQSAAAMSFCRLYVGNDSGTMHLASAAGTRCVAIFSAVAWPGCWYPYGNSHTVLRRSVPCEGCHLPVCVEYDMACLKQITVSEVFEACRAALAEMLSHPAARSGDLASVEEETRKA